MNLRPALQVTESRKRKGLKTKSKLILTCPPEEAESDDEQVLYPQELAEQMRKAKLEQDYEDALAQVTLEEAAKLQKDKEEQEKPHKVDEYFHKQNKRSF